MAAPQKYAHIDFTPPAGARKQAEQGLKLRREHGRGGTAVGIARARDISNGVELSPSTVRRMKAFFDRHASDSKAEGFRRGEKGWPSNGVIANKLWGGPAGYAWAKKVVAQMEAADARSTYSLDAETSTIESGTDRRFSVIPNVERRFLGNFSEADASDPDLLKVEERADPNTGKKQTYLVGYAATFGKNSLLLGDFVERIAPTAFEIVEKRKDGDGKPLETRCLFNHSPDNLLGRFPTTMKMWVDERGLRYECLLPETRADLKELVARGDLKGSSFSFVVAEGGERWTTEEGRSLRLVTKIKSLLDCGPVTYPAYDSATVAVAKRSYDQFVATKPATVAKKRDPEVANRAREVMKKTEEFLAERRAFCPTGPGGGIDNSCGKSNPGVTEATQSQWKKGAALGAKIAAVTSGNVVGGALAGAAVGSFFKEESEALDRQYHFTGLSKEKVSAAAKIIGDDVKVSPDYEGVTLKSKNVEVQVQHGDEWQEAGQTAKGTNAHFLFNRKDGGDAKPSDVKDIIKTGKALGVNHVSVMVSADDKATIAKFEAKGFKVVRAEKGSAAILSKEIKKYDKSQKPGAYRPKEKTKGIVEKVLDYQILAHAAHDVVKGGVGAVTDLPRLGKKTIKTIDATFDKVPRRRMEELQAFLAERRAFCPTGPGGGVKNDCGSKGGGNSVEPKPGPNPNDTPKTLEQQRIEAAGKTGFVTAPKASDKPKSLEQQRLEAAGEWDDRIDPPALADYDGGDNGGFVPDYYKDVTIPGTSQKVKINVDDPEHVKQFIELSAKASGVSTEEFMKANRFGGTLQKVTEHDKVKLFGGDWKKYRTKLARSGGWGNKELDETAKRIGSTLRAARIKGETLAHAVREYAKATGKDPKDEMYSGMKTYQRDPREFMQWARKRLDHYFASGKGKWGSRSTDAYDSVESRIEALSEFLHSRGFCPTGPGGGIDNSCGGGKDDGPSGGIAGGFKGPKTPSGLKGDGVDLSGKYGQSAGFKTKTKMGYDTKKSSVPGKMIDRVAKGEKGSGGTKKSSDGKSSVLGKMIDRVAKGEKVGDDDGPSGGIAGGFKGPKTPSGLKDKGVDLVAKYGQSAGKKGDYKEWKKGDHLDKSKEKDAQDFLDKARTDQLARGGKDGGKSDDGGGVQTWSKGDHFPWTAKQVGTNEGFVQGQHPDGSKTKQYPFKGDSSEAHKQVYEEIKSKKKDKRSVTLEEMKSFLAERSA